MSYKYSIRVYKEYFNFAAAHFMIFSDGDREPLHGHNYRVKVQGDTPELEDDMVFDFLNIKPIVRQVCDELDHKLLMPEDNPHVEVIKKDDLYEVKTKRGHFSFPQSDVLFLPIPNTSAERIAIYIANRIDEEVAKAHQFNFERLEVEVEESPGQSAVFVLNNN